MNRVSLIMLIAIYGRRLMDVVAATKLDHAYYNTYKVSHNQSKKYPCFPILVVVKTATKISWLYYFMQFTQVTI